MHYDIRLGFLAAEAIGEFSKANATKDAGHYNAFLQRSAEYCKEVRNTYGHPVETDIIATMPPAVAEFMRAVIKTQQPSPTITAKLQAVGSLEALLRAIRNEQRQPSDDECLRIARTIYATSAADPR
jgi:hypothetical protein